MRVAVEAIAVEIEMTDDVAFHVRRASTRLGESDTPWTEQSAE